MVKLTKSDVGSGAAVSTKFRGRYEAIKVTCQSGKIKEVRTLVVSGTFAQLMMFYEAFQTHLVPKWRGDKRLEKLYERNQTHAKQDGYLRFQAQDDKRWGDGFIERGEDEESLVRSLAHAIQSTGLAVLPEAQTA